MGLIIKRLSLPVLQELLERQVEKVLPLNDGDDGGGEPESKRRYLVLISTVLTWACTKPMDPVKISG